jgi:site-specific DNA-cytosine methylase
MMVKVLIACEYSGTVRDAFIRAGHDSISCDLLPTDSPGPHHQGDVLEFIRQESPESFDIIIAFPPCFDICVSGSRYWAQKIADGRQGKALKFVRNLMACGIKRIAIENPVGKISSAIRKPDQIIQPYQFGHDASKKTCLWLDNLPPIKPTRYIRPRIVIDEEGRLKERWGNQTDSGQNKLTPSEDRWKIRSKTYQGIAESMAMTWGNIGENEEEQLFFDY